MSALSNALDGARVVVCVGSGGVGKTTTAALVGMEAARSGQRVLVMTVDPARRLATSLGVRGLDHDEQRIELGAFVDVAPGGELWATMLDMKRTFDAIVERSGIDPSAIDDVVTGCVSQAGEQAMQVGRMGVLASKLLPQSTPAVTIDRQCGSSQQAIQFAAQAVMSGTQDVVIASGVESMTRAP
jgi:CO dehydrogenase nickel-insertion accessory protein CooC1